jgi:parvulin-like peptidyl-prolyl isomerase
MEAKHSRLARGALMVGLALLGSGCRGGGATAEGETVLATYDGGEITLEEFDSQVESRAAAGESLAKGEGDWRVAVLEELALREIVAAKADRSTDEQLEAQIEKAREGIYEAAMKRRLGWNEISITDEEVRRYYDEHPEIFVDPEKLRLQHIFVRSEEGLASAEERARARRALEAVRQQVLDGADFAAMAQQHSDSADGPAGGWMILKRGAKAVRSFTEAAWALEPDEVSEIIDTPVGFHIARLAARIPPVERPFEDVRGFATKEVLKVTRRKLEEDYLAAKGPVYGLERHYADLANTNVQDDTVLVSVAGEELTALEFLETAPKEYLPHLFAGYLEYLPRVLDQFALSTILVREAIAAGIPAEEGIEREVAAAKAALRANAEIDRLLAERAQAISEADLREHYEQNKDRFETVRRRSISVIRLPPERERNLWKLLKEGERLADQIRAGADFAEIARRVSVHVSAPDGGRLLQQSDDDLQLRLQGRARGRQIVDALEVGEVSKAFIGEVYDPHKLQFVPSGVYIVRLDEEFPPRQAPFEEVEELVRSNYLRRYYTRFLAELRADMLAEARFKVIKSNLPDVSV